MKCSSPALRCRRRCLPAILVAAVIGSGDKAAGTDSAGLRIRSEVRLAEIGRIRAELAQLQQELARRLPLDYHPERIEVFIFGNWWRYHNYLRQRYPEAASRRAFFVRHAQRNYVYACAGNSLVTDLRHETTHALLHSALPMVPLWLDEGLAEYFEVPPDRRDRDQAHASPVRLAARVGYVPPLEPLESRRGLDELSAADYRHAWAWAHFLLEGPPPARDELQQFLREIAAHAPPGTLSRRLKQRLKDPRAAFREHFLQAPPAAGDRRATPAADSG